MGGRLIKFKINIFFTFLLIVTLINNLYGSNLTEDNLFELSLEELMEIEISSASRISQKLLDAPASVIVFSRNDIEQNGYEYLGDILKNLPGINVIDNSGGFGEYYYFHGISGNDRFLVFINGHKLNFSSGAYLSVGNSIPIKYADQVEILYGPSSVMYGSEAFSAIINIVTNFRESESLFLDVKAGSFHTKSFGFRLDDILKRFSPDLNIMLLGDIYASDGVDLLAESDRYSYNSEIFPNYNYIPSQPIDDYFFDLSGNYHSYSFGFIQRQFREGNANSLDPNQYLYLSDNIWTNRNTVIWGGYERIIGEYFSINSDISYVKNHIEPETKFLKYFTSEDTSYAFHQYMTGVDESFKANSVLNYRFKYGEFTGGIELEYLKSIPPYANDYVFDGKPYEYVGEVRERIENELTLKEQKLGLFSQLTINFLEGRLKSNLGLRLDYSKMYEETLNPRVAIIINPNSKLNIKLIYAHAFQVPSLFYQYEQFGSATMVMIPNPNLTNQKIINQSIDVFYALAKHFTLLAQFHKNYMNDLIIRTFYSESEYNQYFDTYSYAVRNENIGEGSGLGVDLTLKYDYKSKAKFSLSYSYLETELKYLGDSQAISGTSPHSLKGSFTITGINNLILSVQSRWFSGFYTTDRNDIYSGSMQPGYLVFDSYIKYKDIYKNVDISLKINNLFNSTIEQPGLFGQTGAYIPVISQPGINAVIGIHVKL